MFTLEIKYHICHTGLATYQKQFFCIYANALERIQSSPKGVPGSVQYALSG